MKKLLIVIVILVNCISLITQTLVPEGDVSGDWLINGSPYLIDGLTI